MTSDHARRQQGTVSWFNEKKGFGFITAADGRDVFVHFNEIERDGFQTLHEGEAVSFRLEDEAGAPKAVGVRVHG
jgi:CspA family cold shock protein